LRPAQVPSQHGQTSCIAGLNRAETSRIAGLNRADGQHAPLGLITGGRVTGRFLQ
jgi:hypothetical protein